MSIEGTPNSTTAQGWRNDPAGMHDAFVRSPAYRESTRSNAGPLPADHRAAESSVIVHKCMFQSYLRHLDSLGVAFLEARPANIDSYRRTLGYLNESSRPKYLRLVERTYDHLLDIGLLKTNPARELRGSLVSQGMRGWNDPAPESRVKAASEEIVFQEEIEKLRRWHREMAAASLEGGFWKPARDHTIAAIALSTGMRTVEFAALRRDHVAHVQQDEGGRIVFEVTISPPVAALSVPERSITLQGTCAALFATWWNARWCGLGDVVSGSTEKALTIMPGGDRIFPATKKGGCLSVSAVCKNLRALADLAVSCGVLTPQTKWVLSRGGRGMRNAYGSTQVQSGVDLETLRTNLGYWRPQAVRGHALRAKVAQGVRIRPKPSP